MVTLTRDDDDNNKVVVAALVTQHTHSSLATVGPVLGQEESVHALLHGIKDSLLSASATDMALIVSDHSSLVQTLTKAGFETSFELGAMTMNGLSMPGERDLYLALIHPTLG